MRWLALALDCLALALIAFLTIYLTSIHLYPSHEIAAIRNYGAVSVTLVMGFVGACFWGLIRFVTFPLDSPLNKRLQILLLAFTGSWGIFTKSIDSKWNHDVSLLLGLAFVAVIVTGCYTYLKLAWHAD